MKEILFGMAASLIALPCAAAECRSVSGNINGQSASAVRHVSLKKLHLTLSGRMNGKTMPARTLTCMPLAKGVYCERYFGPVYITVMANGKRMVEVVNDSATKAELAHMSYVCDKAIR